MPHFAFGRLLTSSSIPPSRLYPASDEFRKTDVATERSKKWRKQIPLRAMRCRGIGSHYERGLEQSLDDFDYDQGEAKSMSL